MLDINYIYYYNLIRKIDFYFKAYNSKISNKDFTKESISIAVDNCTTLNFFQKETLKFFISLF